MASSGSYYIPHEAKWPIVGSIGLFAFFVGFGNWLNGESIGQPLFYAGLAIIVVMMYGWFSLVVNESESGTYNSQVDVSFRMGMMWFIFSEVMFFAAFFGALFYARVLSGPWLGGEGAGEVTNAVLWSNYGFSWPFGANGPAGVGGEYQPMGAFGLPLINTVLLLTSGVTCTIAHHAIQKDDRAKMVRWLGATVGLGAIFVYCQGLEYAHGYQDLNLTLESGIYGSTFYLLTGFHGFHVTMGAIMLFVVMLRGMRGHFSAKSHFAFEAAAWYWHFVDVVWLGLFIFVYFI